VSHNSYNICTRGVPYISTLCTWACGPWASDIHIRQTTHAHVTTIIIQELRKCCFQVHICSLKLPGKWPVLLWKLLQGRVHSSPDLSWICLANMDIQAFKICLTFSLLFMHRYDNLHVLWSIIYFKFDRQNKHNMVHLQMNICADWIKNEDVICAIF